MSDDESPPIPDAPPKQSRRDFLRRASKEAAKEVVEIGVKVVPGAAIAKRFIEGGKEASPDAATEEGEPKPNPIKNPLAWLAAWRKDKAKP